ncbi:MAG: nucleotidyltransferase [Deltaproteobacteria bacterium]|nr:nucleotidyltransferase [Deltaproteobacteria bacterium]
MIEALLDLIKIFERESLKYCLIGGLAMMLYGGRANTIDIDFYLLVDDLGKILALLKKRKIGATPAGDFQIKARYKGVPIDLLLADHYLGQDVVQRAKKKKLGDKIVKVATPEDLIILKTLADRSIDHRDIEELKEIFGKTLDQKYISKKLKTLKKILDS